MPAPKSGVYSPRAIATRWKPGQSGNPKGPACTSLTNLLRQMLDRTSLCDSELPGGRTVAEALAERILAKAIEGSAPHVQMVLERLEGKVSATSEPEGKGTRYTFQFVSNEPDPLPTTTPAESPEPKPELS